MSERENVRRLFQPTFVIVGFVLVGCSFSMPRRGDDPSGTVVACRRAVAPVAVDGIGSEEAWRRAQPIDGFSSPGKVSSGEPKGRTIARLLWDDGYLYFLAEMKDDEIVSASRRPDDRLWLGDVFEIFLKPDRRAPGYYELQVNPANAHLDMYLRRRQADAYERWRSTDTFGWQTAVRRTDVGWSVEGRIPWSDLALTGGAPKTGDVWRFALCRYDYSANRPPVLSTSAPLQQPSFHRYEEWGELRFVDRRTQ